AGALALAAALTALTSANWFAGAAPPAEGVLTTFDLATMDLDRHVLVRRPQCASCGWIDRDPARAPVPTVLHSRRKRLGRQGAHRSVPPGETVERFSEHVSPHL